jgi:hypothetical protein
MAKGGFTAIKSALAAFLVVAFLAWILSLIGLAGLQRSCYDISTLGSTTGLSTGGESESPFASNLALTGIRGAYMSILWRFNLSKGMLLVLFVDQAAGLTAAVASYHGVHC